MGYPIPHLEAFLNNEWLFVYKTICGAKLLNLLF